MKIHPLPTTNKRSIIIHLPTPSIVSLSKKLRRLPHIFSRVVELPFKSDADVEIEEHPDFFCFIAEMDGLVSSVIAHMVEIYPGDTKIVVRPRGHVRVWDLDQLELEVWRFRLLDGTQPKLSTTICVDGELIIRKVK